MSDLSYTANGNGHTVWRDRKNIGAVRKLGFYWLAFSPKGDRVHGTFGSMSGAAGRLSEIDQEGTRKA